MAEDRPGFVLPFGLTLAQVVTLGGVLAAFVGSVYVNNYKLSEITADIGEFHKVLLEHQTVLERQAEYARRLTTLEDRLERLEQRR